MPDGTHPLARKALQSKAIETFLEDNDFRRQIDVATHMVM
jgi:hypothetical protein